MASTVDGRPSHHPAALAPPPPPPQDRVDHELTVTNSADHDWQVMIGAVESGGQSAMAPSYIFSICGANVVSTTFRLTFSDGVSSPVSTERSRGRISNFFTVSQRFSLVLSSLT